MVKTQRQGNRGTVKTNAAADSDLRRRVKKTCRSNPAEPFSGRSDPPHSPAWEGTAEAAHPYYTFLFSKSKCNAEKMRRGCTAHFFQSRIFRNPLRDNFSSNGRTHPLCAAEKTAVPPFRRTVPASDNAPCTARAFPDWQEPHRTDPVRQELFPHE